METVSLGELHIEQAGSEPKTIELTKDVTTFGRAPDNDVVLADQRASRHHAKLVHENDHFRLVDLGSSNGTWVKERRISGEEELGAGASFVIGSSTLTLDIKDEHSAATETGIEVPAAGSAATISMTVAPPPESTSVQNLRLEKDVLTLGRDPFCDLVLNHPAVSRIHAEIRKEGNDFYIFDLKSTNGTYVNSQQVDVRQQLKPGDEIRIGSYRIIFDGESLASTNESGNIRLDVIHIKKTVGKGVVLLNDISLSILPREFVALVGVSGAGKSTLLDALNGFRPASEGSVMANGANLYRSYNAYRTQIGYVPQEDIIHRELTVYEALDYAARLRMPSDTAAVERRQRIADVLNDLSLTAAKDRPISRLSGGQRKRVSIGVELLTRPSLFFLDEATSGLDPGTENQLMHLLATLADQGRTIVLITHATKNVMLCDQVIFLAKGGNLAYFGPPSEALTYFGVKDFDEIYGKLEQELSPTEWAERYKQSAQYRQYVGARLREAVKAVPYVPVAVAESRQTAKPAAKGTSSLAQFLILSQRSLNILARDRASLLLMLIIAPLIGGIDFITWQKNVLSAKGGNAGQALTMLSMMSLICVLVGSIASMREIVKEADIYRRERMVTLRLIPYVLSKVWIGVLLALYQGVIFILSKRLSVGWPTVGTDILQTYATLVLAVVCGMLLGLLISALSPNQNVAPLLLIVVLVAQFMFSGGLLPISSLGTPGKVLSQITSAKWAYESLVTISGLGKDVALDRCWQLPKDQRTALTDQDKSSCNCMGAGIFSKCNFPGIADLYDPAVDAPQPVEPQAPATPAQPPAKPAAPADQSPAAQQAFQAAMQSYQTAMDGYQTQLTAYQSSVTAYQQNMSTWQTQYQNWKAAHDRAISSAEARIDKINEDFGDTFNVDLKQHWAWLGGISGALFLLILVVQKRKDVV